MIKTMSRRVNNHSPEMRGTWLLTFNDMITLMLTFFVLILSMSSIETTKVKDVADSVKRVLGIKLEQEGNSRGVIESVIPSLRDADIERERTQKDRKKVSRAFTDKREALSKAVENLEGQKMIQLKNGYSLSMNEQLLFPPGSAEISNAGHNALQALGEILQRSDALIRVEGNTDDLPISTGKYPSNWELSLARAVNVVKCLISSGIVAPERLSAAGYADTRPRVVNDSVRNRQLNRRLDIILTFPEN
jgi:chemotaxis protein MotB